MTTAAQINNMVRRSSLAVASLMVAGLALASEANAQEGIAASPKVRANLNLGQIKTKTEAEDLKAGDMLTMVCAKCKSVMVHNVTTEKGHIKVMTVGEKHMCPGCSSTITTVGVGHGAKNEVKHVCDKCGSDSVFCCATKPGTGMTPGMEKK